MSGARKHFYATSVLIHIMSWLTKNQFNDPRADKPNEILPLFKPIDIKFIGMFCIDIIPV